jgi:hypothetical protein
MAPRAIRAFDNEALRILQLAGLVRRRLRSRSPIPYVQDAAARTSRLSFA